MSLGPEGRGPDLHPVAVDTVLFGVQDDVLKVLLIQRGLAPALGRWALPGGFVRGRERLEDAVHRELAEEAGVVPDRLVQLGAFSGPDRDLRWIDGLERRVLSVAFMGLVRVAEHQPRPDTDADAAAWFPLGALPPLAFDHAEIVAAAHARLLEWAQNEPVGVALLPEAFTLSALQAVYEALLGVALDKRNFRRKSLASGLLRDTGALQRGVPHRAARLYTFDAAAFAERGRSLFG